MPANSSGEITWHDGISELHVHPAALASVQLVRACQPTPFQTRTHDLLCVSALTCMSAACLVGNSLACPPHLTHPHPHRSGPITCKVHAHLMRAAASNLSPLPHACRHNLTLSSYLLGVCALLHVLTFLFTHWSTRVAAGVSCSKPRSLAGADKVLVIPEKFNGAMEICRLERRILVGAGVVATEEGPRGCRGSSNRGGPWWV